MTPEEQEIIKVVRKHTMEIRKFSDGMKFMTDVDILNRIMPMIVSLFKATSERKDGGAK